MTNSRFTHFLKSRTKWILGSTIPLFALVLFILPNISSAQCTMICSNKNVSLDENCSAFIDYRIILDSNQCVGGDFSLQLKYLNDVPVPTSPYVGRSELGQIKAEVWDANSGNYCWSILMVEDKIGPSLECDTAYLTCLELAVFPGPRVVDNCFDPDEITVTSLGDQIEIFNCDPNYMERRIRTWQATDGSGRSATCDQVIFVERLDTSLITFPSNHTVLGGNALLCSNDNDLNNDGVIDPEITGVPFYDTLSMYPWNNALCNLQVSFNDTDFGVINCTHKIMRTWTISEWWCNQEVLYNAVQIIEIADTTGPTITCPSDLTVTTNASSCESIVYLPPATAMDDCAAIIRYDVNYPGGSLINQNGGNVNLPVGVHTITYIAYDACYNSASCTMEVTVADNTPPIPVCDQHTAVSLTNNGKARIPASTFDDGSYDECGIDRFEVARMTPACGYDDLFRDYVEFGCCDLTSNPIMVIFRVYDLSGNYNDCMVEVEVQDKITPAIVCPPDITVSCEYPYDMTDLSQFGIVHVLDSATQINSNTTDPRNDVITDDINDPNYTGAVNWGKEGYAYGSCSVSVSENSNVYMNQCGEGFIARTFTATNASGQSVSCTQTISFHDFTPFTIDNIEWPDDITVTGSCSNNIDPSVTGRPTFDGADCEMIAISDPEDLVFTFDSPDDPACFKVLRKWTVLNWCTYDDVTGEGLYTRTQTIKVMNTIAPTIDSCQDVEVCSTDPNCGPAFIATHIIASDDCSTQDELSITYSIDLDNDGTFDVHSSNNPYASVGNAHNEADGVYPIGIHRIVWSVEDNCGNITTCGNLINVKNCKKPIAYCYNGLAAELTPMDTDGDGEIDNAMTSLWASDFDAGSSHPCYDDVLVSFSETDVLDTGIVFDCNDLGINDIEIWVHAPNGEVSRCVTYVIIQDNNNVCDNISVPLATVGGETRTENGTSISDARVDLEGSNGMYDMTDNLGAFEFPGMPLGGSYTVVPDREHDHPLNGVTANDMSIIQRHVAGIEELSSDYKHFAADATNDQTIDIRDVLELRKLLLGIITELPDNQVWRFFDETCPLNPANPLLSGCVEAIAVPHLIGDVMNVDFVGVKIGDVDGDAALDMLTEEAEERDGDAIVLQLPNLTLEAGKSYSIAFEAEDMMSINAMQFTLSFDASMIQVNDVKELQMKNMGVNKKFLSRGSMTQAWAAPLNVTFDAADQLFQLEITALADVNLSEVVEINSSMTDAIAFSNGVSSDLKLSFGQEKTTVVETQFELYQNKPNPFFEFTTIAFNLPKDEVAKVTVTDLTGKTLYRTEVNGTKGYNELTISKNELQSVGVLFYHVETEAQAATRKMTLFGNE